MRRVYLIGGVPDSPADSPVRLDADASNYVVRVLRIPRGESVALFGPTGEPRVARLEESDPKGAWVRLSHESVPAQVVDTPFPVTLLQALLRARKLENVLQKATELGVAAVWPVVTERCVKVPQNERVEHQVARWQRICGEAVRQCLRRQVPLVRAPMSLQSALEQLPAKEGHLKLVLWERECGRSLRQMLESTSPEQCSILVGPEGGLSAQEVDRCVAFGFVPVSLGPRIVRAETAPLVALSAVQLAWGDMR